MPSSYYFTANTPLRLSPAGRNWSHTSADQPLPHRGDARIARSAATIPDQGPSQSSSATDTNDGSPTSTDSDLHEFGAESKTPTLRYVLKKPELLRLVPQYHDDETVQSHINRIQDPYMRGFAPADGPVLRVSDTPEDTYLVPSDDQNYTSLEDLATLSELRLALSQKSRKPGLNNEDAIWQLYQDLPEPRITYLTSVMRHRLMWALGSIDKKNTKTMLRYFSVIGDIKNCGLAVTRGEWNGAMSFAARYVGKTTATEAETVLRMWREMEHEANTQGNEITFNILFDAASKAGHFELAEMIYQEMENRKIPYNRYHHISMIHFFGLKQDSDGLRAAYKDMVEAGEMIDTTVLNCVMIGFLRCGEEDAAQAIYETMKTTHPKGLEIARRDYTTQKRMTQVFMMFARVAKEVPSMRSNLQRTVATAPDLHTYRILVKYWGPRRGDLSKVVQLLDEMQSFNVPLHGSIFLALFKGFQLYGRSGAIGRKQKTPGPHRVQSKPVHNLGSLENSSTPWTLDRLENVWAALLDALDAGADGLHITTWLATAVLGAFSHHCPPSELMEIYDQLRDYWDMDHSEEQYMLDYLSQLIPDRGAQGFNQTRHSGKL